jgi:3-hydroxyacyl-CoA dehydrogenase/enoyl-CoA hydratase/carnithine racemase
VSDTHFQLERDGDVAIVRIENDDDRPTVFSRGAMESLADVLAQLEAGDFRACVITGKPGFFAAGADIDEFPGITRERAVEGSRAGHELFARVRALPFPTVAGINGVCLGGGVELALHCDARVIAADVRAFALPEVFLGIIPAWGGTQLVPRLVPPETAVKFVVENPLRQNRMLNAEKALEYGLVDGVADPKRLLDEAVALATSVPKREAPDMSEVEEVIRKARSRVDDVVHGATPAPYRALDLIAGVARWSLEDGYRAEEEAIGELLPGRQAQASIYAFNVVERRAKRGPGVPRVEARAVRKVGFVGAGLMATQIATLFAKRLRVPLVLRDVEQSIVDDAVETIVAQVDGAQLSGGTGWDGFAECDLVLEAVVERLDVKQQVFSELRGVTSDDCVLATNTSSLSVAEMGADLGLHFFNPVAVMPLVELVRTDDTDDTKLATAWHVTQALRKRAVVVGDTPGFVVNRILTRMTSVLMDALEHGASVEETDEALLGLGMPMAPSVLLQMVGPPVAWHTLETMHGAFPDRFPLSPTLRNLAEGREEIVVLEERPQSVEEIREAALVAVADEVKRLLDEGVVAEAADVDACLLLGAGWPFFMGGVTKYLDQTGISERLFARPLADLGTPAPA